MLIVGTYPAIRAFRVEDAKGTWSTSKELQDILESKKGEKYFQLYLSTELSLENLLFYKAVTKWKKAYKAESVDTQERAYWIKEVFLEDSTLEVNVSADVKKRVKLAIPNKKVKAPIDVFDSALHEVQDLMAFHSFPRFLRSDFYKLYTGELNLKSVNKVVARGVRGMELVGQLDNSKSTNSETDIQNRKLSMLVDDYGEL